LTTHSSPAATPHRDVQLFLRAELARLKVSDVDSQRMIIHVQGGKGRKERDVLLSLKLLDELGRHCRRFRRKSSMWPSLAIMIEPVIALSLRR
jgi:integrase/recombinase XerD